MGFAYARYAGARGNDMGLLECLLVPKQKEEKEFESRFLTRFIKELALTAYWLIAPLYLVMNPHERKVFLRGITAPQPLNNLSEKVDYVFAGRNRRGIWISRFTNPFIGVMSMGKRKKREPEEPKEEDWEDGDMLEDLEKEED
jgi:hypothetical protein